MQALRFFVHPQVRHWKLLTENRPGCLHAAGSICPSGAAEGKERNYPRTLPSGSSPVPLGAWGAQFASLVPFKTHNIHLYVHYHVSFPKNYFLIIWVNQLVFPHSSPIISCNLRATSGLEDSSALSRSTKILPSPPSILTMLSSSVEFQGLDLG